jgi:hypothetical protein
MMKKLLAVILVLGMASIANADLVLSVNGEVAPDEITIATSDIITLDLMVTEGTITGGQVEIVLSNPQGELLQDAVWFPDNASFMFAWYVMAQDSSHIEITGGNFGPVAAPLVIMDGLLFHCVEETEVIIDLHVTGDTTIDGESVPISTILDTITVTQIPEPMTVALLGLGGLFLLRRRK